jgi:alanyl-tRNA synthetase
MCSGASSAAPSATATSSAAAASRSSTKLVAPLVAEMGAAYPELAKQAAGRAVLRGPRRSASPTPWSRAWASSTRPADLQGTVIPGEAVFRLYDTYGFPADLTADIARERGLTLDMDGFEREMAEQKERSRAAASSAPTTTMCSIEGETDFTGYEDI